ncbi:MAG: VWA domain-containing protein [Saprospiraceae bacterium]|nr:VWA domain-containing protein [Saprospiraceae bacterium]
MFSKIASISFLLSILSFGMFYNTTNADSTRNIEQHFNGKEKIQVALLLDLSGSMDGLIEQAKSRLWNIVNTMSTLKCKGETPSLEIALYEYGKSNLPAKNHFIRQVLPFTKDLDLVSEMLFSLRTNGGEEYCGAVIESAVQELNWQAGISDLKLIYIAGNEPFNQGPISYAESVSKALQKSIYVNTIFCGNTEEGINTHWYNGAILGNGKYFSINSDDAVVFISTPYDEKIERLNKRLNETYIGYGSKHHTKQQNQITQDRNAEMISKSNMTERIITKSQSNYNNVDWDLVDKMKEDKTFLTKMKKEEMPVELQGKTDKEREEYILEKKNQREQIQREISALSVKRQQFIDIESKKSNQNYDDLGTSIVKSIHEIAIVKGYTTIK